MLKTYLLQFYSEKDAKRIVSTAIEVGLSESVWFLTRTQKYNLMIQAVPDEVAPSLIELV